jgi:protein-S-isoprenylcysteine O-methyltransferase Ste14
MTQGAESELVTSGPYRFVRHPIYTGLLAGLLGTAIMTSPMGLVVVAILAGIFSVSAVVEEKNLMASFPTAYPQYRATTKMVIPFIL